MKRRLPRKWKITNGLLHMADPDEDRWACAIHEAGHAVVAEALGCQVQVVWLAGSRSGYTEVRYPVIRKRIGHDPLLRSIVAMAGHEAEVSFCRRPSNLLPAGDAQTLISSGMTKRSLPILCRLARYHMARNRSKILAVAQALLRSRKKSLTRRAFLRSLR